MKNGVETVSEYNENNQLTRSETAGVTTRYFYDKNGNNVRIAKPGEVTRTR